tara:strand:+ start:1048 stop:2151 length:1104 start_codon:yes stop_codon:yes gene_type:complete
MDPLDVYGEQLKSLEHDRLKGAVSEAEYHDMRAEVGRRMISVEKTNKSAKTVRYSTEKWSVIAYLLLAALIGGASYLRIGQPSFPDVPISFRYNQAEMKRTELLSQAEAEAKATIDLPTKDPENLPLLYDLRAAVESNPNDITGLEFLVNWEAHFGFFQNAYKSKAKVLDLKGEEAGSVDWYEFAELLILAADNYVSIEAEVALRKALGLDSKNPQARFYIGLQHQQLGRPDITFNMWRQLLEEGPESASYISLIRAVIMDLAFISGVNYTPLVAKGPTREDYKGVSELSAEDQKIMINEMVSGLAEKLASQGGPATDWVKLIIAYSVQGQPETSRKIWNEAKALFSNNIEDLNKLNKAAKDAGIAP